MSNTVSVQNRQHSYSLDVRLLRDMVRTLLNQLLHIPSFDLSISVLAAPEMTRLNQQFLKHEGSTDVLAFDYHDSEQAGNVMGEIVICADEASRQAARFGTTWQSELIRYSVHGILHLLGYDDHHPANKRKMKQKENRLLRELERHFDFTALEKLISSRRLAAKRAGPRRGRAQGKVNLSKG